MGQIKTAIQITDGFSPAFKSMNNALSVVMSSLAQTQKALGKPVDLSSVTKAQQDLARVASSLDQMEREALQASKGQDQLNNSMRQGESTASALIGKVKGLIGAYAGLQGAKSLIGGADQFTNISSRLDLMNDGLQTTQELTDMVWESANRTLSSFSATADAVGKFGIQASDAFSNAKDVVNFAEQINKHIAIAGTEGAAADGAMIQMVQAMSNGVLRGEELNSVLDGMPTVAKVIKEEFARMGDTRGIKEIAEKGLITADVVKRALYNAADETNKKFNDMGVTFGQLWNLFRNHADKALQPVYKQLGKISNSQEFKTLAQVAGGAFALIGYAAGGVIKVVGGLFDFIRRNADWTIPILGGVALAFTAQGVAALWAKREILANAVATGIKTVKDWLATGAIIAMELAQHGLNAAIAMCPISWIVGAIIGLIVVFYLAVAAVNRFAGTSYSATGMIAGFFMGLYATIYNIVAHLWNTFASYAEFLMNVFQNPVYSIKALFTNLAVTFLDGVIGMTKGWDKFATSFANAFLEAINWVLEGWNKLIDIMPDFVKEKLGLGKATKFEARTSITSDLTSARNGLIRGLGSQPDNYKTVPKMVAKNIGAEVAKGYDNGSHFVKYTKYKIQGALGGTQATKEMSAKEMLANANKTPASGYGGALGQIAKNTGKTAQNTDSLSANDDELRYLRELGEREAINKFTTAEIKLDVKNNNSISNDMDLDGVVSALTNKLRDAMFIVAEGSHI